MNTYTVEFFARCPANSLRIKYRLEISTHVMLMVEDIVDEVEGIERGFHEDIADRLQAKFGGHQTMTAHHHGVDIKTVRGRLS